MPVDALAEQEEEEAADPEAPAMMDITHWMPLPDPPVAGNAWQFEYFKGSSKEVIYASQDDAPSWMRFDDKDCCCPSTWMPLL